MTIYSLYIMYLPVAIDKIVVTWFQGILHAQFHLYDTPQHSYITCEESVPLIQQW